MTTTTDVRAALDAYAATETDAFINAFHFVDGGVWRDIEEEADRYNRQDVAPAPFAALRAVLDLHPRIPGYDGADWFMCATCRLIADDSCPTVRAIATALHLPASA